MIENSGQHDVILKHGLGNIETATGDDITIKPGDVVQVIATHDPFTSDNQIKIRMVNRPLVRRIDV